MYIFEFNSKIARSIFSFRASEVSVKVYVRETVTMSRRPWDDIGIKGDVFVEEKPKMEVKKEERTLEGDLKLLGKHCVFGGLIGGVSGVSLAAIEIVRDPKAIATGSGAGSRAKTLRYGALMGGFFAAFHGVRQGFNMSLPSSGDRTNDFLVNTAMSTFITTTPLLIKPRLRSVVPYAVALIFLDAINAYTEGDLR